MRAAPAALGLALLATPAGAQTPSAGRTPSAVAVEPAGPYASLDSGLTRIVRAEIARCPATAPQDLYKLLHQASMGAAHAGLDSAAATNWMADEWPKVGRVRAGERLVDTIAPGGRMVRLNLRPWRAAGGTPAPVVAAFVATAAEVPRPTTFIGYWQSLVRSAARGAVRMDTVALIALAQRKREEQFPAVEHTPRYERACGPHYRVLTGALADSLLGTLHLRPADTIFKAVGTEPFWGVVVRNDSILVTSPEQPSGLAFGARAGVVRGILRIWRARSGTHALTIVAGRGSCGDGMSDAIYEFRVRVRLDGRHLRGCGGAKTGGEGGP